MSIWDTVAAPIIKIIDKIVPDKAAAQAAKDSLNQMIAQGNLNEEMAQLTAVTTAQSDINKVEAASTSIFVSGWRPFIGWVCGTAFGFQFLLKPLIEWGMSLAGHPIKLPGLDDALTQLTYALLGMGALRSIDKKMGTAAK